MCLIVFLSIPVWSVKLNKLPLRSQLYQSIKLTLLRATNLISRIKFENSVYFLGGFFSLPVLAKLNDRFLNVFFPFSIPEWNVKFTQPLKRS